MTAYDRWRLSPPEEHHAVGMEFGDECARYHEPDEDAPRGYKPRPCSGVMIDDDGVVLCDTCRETAV